MLTAWKVKKLSLVDELWLHTIVPYSDTGSGIARRANLLSGYFC